MLETASEPSVIAPEPMSENALVLETEREPSVMVPDAMSANVPVPPTGVTSNATPVASHTLDPERVSVGR